MTSPWEAVIGLEIHVQLNTKTKLFSPAPNQFGEEPNTNISEICTGQPGALPLLNQEAVRKAVLFGLAVQAEIALVSTFDRKSYFYPDSPRNFQITQFENPIIRKGKVHAEVQGKVKPFFISQAHLEDDAGMLKHFSSFAGIDYNRAGVPLIEIVSEPCMHSPEEASSYAKAIKAIFQYLDASDCNMEEGSLRFDANISVRPKGSSLLRPKVEIKNMNSFNFLEMAIACEVEKQIHLYEKHPHEPVEKVIESGTYRWDTDKKTTVLMRKKEKAEDYRYFPEPDLTPLILTKKYIEALKAHLPELPEQRRERYLHELQLSPEVVHYLVLDKTLSDYFEKALSFTSQAKLLGNWITVEFAGKLKDTGATLLTKGILPEHLASLVNLIQEQKITGRIAKSVADDMLASPGKDPAQIVKENPDYQPLKNTAEMEALVDQVLLENNQSILDYRAGKTKAFAFLVGQVMKLTRGKASPQIVNELLHKKLDSNG